MQISKTRLRQIHFTLAPILLFPVLLSLITGSLFQIAVLTDSANDFLWLLELHRGKFGSINLEMIYPFLNAFGMLMLATTGIMMWWQYRPRSANRTSSNPKTQEREL
ncbi:PepSY domain-containing protein [Lusitaniella coriacea LEGE 07157]|uniref:PepSY domain-containing protein n=1 Tax=Lusitaniella coriacea LEGE 07157 TaxID=945747 RepID=A0A8J7DXC9_9CYAN|nr:PepSY domain-containing protein [Lusitaniella coriacea]MBE9116720.1 PepSY domain-containing protein [Lusitaniella coriacea LEGE 07157]